MKTCFRGEVAFFYKTVFFIVNVIISLHEALYSLMRVTEGSGIFVQAAISYSKMVLGYVVATVAVKQPFPYYVTYTGVRGLRTVCDNKLLTCT